MSRASRFERTGSHWRRFGIRRGHSGRRVYLVLWRRRHVGPDMIESVLAVRIPRNPIRAARDTLAGSSDE